jgi:hypothetical protein
MWCGVNALVACSATIIVRPLDAAQYFNQTGAGSRAPGRVVSSRAGAESNQVRTLARKGGGMESLRRCLAKGQVHPQRLVILHEGRRDQVAGEDRRLRPGRRDHWDVEAWRGSRQPSRSYPAPLIQPAHLPRPVGGLGLCEQGI